MKLGIMIFVFPEFSRFQNEQFPSRTFFAYRAMGGRGSVFLNILSQIKIEVWDYWIATIQVLLKEKLYNLIFSSGNMRVVKSDQFISIEQE